MFLFFRKKELREFAVAESSLIDAEFEEAIGRHEPRDIPIWPKLADMTTPAPPTAKLTVEPMPPTMFKLWDVRSPMRDPTY